MSSVAEITTQFETMSVAERKAAMTVAGGNEVTSVRSRADLTGGITALKRLLSRLSVLNLSCLAFLVFYAYSFWKNVSRYWFHPGWTTDDGLQQLYPFHAVYHPEIFKGDLITSVMEGYLAPIHYWLSYFVTWIVENPIMMGHWLMLIQALSAGLFLFLAVRYAAGFAPACLSVIWMIHSRHIMQRMTGGLPRGWAALVFASFFYFVFKKNHTGVLISLFIGCLLHPPATLTAALAYGFYLFWGVVRRKTRGEFIKPLVVLVLLSPLYIVTTWSVVKRPESVGQMVSYDEAAQMPEFQYPTGRFPFVPLRSVREEIRTYAFQSFVGRFFHPRRYWKGSFLEKIFGSPEHWKQGVRYIAVGLLLVLLCIGVVRKREVIPVPLICFLLAIFSVYFASRLLAFKLYVPNRHLQFPLGFFCITTFVIGLWRALYLKKEVEMTCVSSNADFQYRDTRLRVSALSALGLCGLGYLVFVAAGTGLYGTANFNYSFTKKGNVFKWVRSKTPEDALIAGHPTYIDGVMLFGMRRGFATTETAHPFYRGYQKEIKRRLEISLKAHYASSLAELIAIVEPEGIDYFVFERKRFNLSALSEATYHPPLDVLVKNLAGGDPGEFAYRELVTIAKANKSFDGLAFIDSQAAVLDVAVVKEYLELQELSNKL